MNKRIFTVELSTNEPNSISAQIVHLALMKYFVAFVRIDVRENPSTDEGFELKALKIWAAANSAEANALTLFLAGLFGEKKTTTGEDGTVTISKWRGKYYMLDYVEPVIGEKGRSE